MTTLYKNIKGLCGIDQSLDRPMRGKQMSRFDCLENAWLKVSDGMIAEFGPMSTIPADADTSVDLSGQYVLPAYCDSHSHLVFASARDGEFVDRIKGLSYEEIAKRGGGILNSVEKLREMPEDELYEDAVERLREVILQGTGAIEIKSGYGLDLESELKMLRVIRRLKALDWIPISSTLLAAHAIPPEFKGRKKDYMKLVIDTIIPEVAEQGLADAVDIFCEEGYFDVNDTGNLLKRALEFGLRGKIHVNQFNVIGGVRVGVEENCISVDHLELVEDDDIQALKGTDCISTVLPSCSFFLSIPYAPARRLMDEDLPVALASDFNPGSTPSGNMNMVISLACIKQKMLPEEAFNAATINGAWAMQAEKEVGSISRGKRANFIVTKAIPSLAYIPYAFGQNHIDKVVINGLTFS